MIPVMFLVSSASTLVIAWFVNTQMNNYEEMVTTVTENHLTASVLSLANLISAEELDLFHTLQDTKTYEEKYQEIIDRLILFGEENNVLFAYYWRDYGYGKLQYIVDNDPDPETWVGPWVFEDITEDAAFTAINGKVGVTDLGDYSKDWEGLLTAYAPVFDNEGKVYCVAGVDISDEFIFLQREDSRRMTILMIIVVPIALAFGILSLTLYGRKAKQIEEAHTKLQYFNTNMRRAFSTYLSEDVVEEIVSDPTRLQLGGTKREMSVLFTDVQNFTYISETLPPEQLVELLNYYLSSFSDIILEQNGTIDKYQGDAIMSFFGAPIESPDHALQACTTAIVMKRKEAQVNEYIKEHKLSPTPLYTRIGINSGDMIVGNMGTEKKMNYTIISNAVNLASRLEGVNKIYKTWILASENTVQQTRDRLLVRKLDRIRVVGINEPVRIYEILETRANATDTMMEKLVLFNRAFAFFEERKWKEAGIQFNQLVKKYPDDGPSVLFLKRCKQFFHNPPSPDWDGVFNITEK